MTLSVMTSAQSHTQLLITDAESVHHVDDHALSQLLRTSPGHLSTFLLDRQGGPLEVLLQKIPPASLSPERIHYRGRIVQQPKSIVTLTIDDLSIKGLISDERGNYTFHTDQHGRIRINRSDEHKSAGIWACHAQPDMDSNHHKPMHHPQQKEGDKSMDSGDTIKVLFVSDHALYQRHNESIDDTKQYVEDLFIQVQTLYDREGIAIAIEDILVWDTPDPYDHRSPQQMLVSFRSQLGEGYPGHVAQLLSGDTNLSGGVAFVNGLCHRRRSYGFNRLTSSLNDPDSYTWDVHVVAHELGHTLGSQHTHDCVWGPNGDTAIDACAGSSACPGAPIPETGGTIMSYCHTQSVGVNFSLGFGPEPGGRIRQTISQCLPSYGEVCPEAISIHANGQYHIEGITAGDGATDPQSTHAKWYRYTAPEDGQISISSCHQNVDTRVTIYRGLCSDLTQIASGDDDCLSGGGLNYAAAIEHLDIGANQSIWIEWDDRWSADGFTFTFEFAPDQVGEQPCSGEALPMEISTDTDYLTMSTTTYEGSVINQSKLMIQSGEGIVLGSGFSLENDTQLSLQIGGCIEGE